MMLDHCEALLQHLHILLMILLSSISNDLYSVQEIVSDRVRDLI